MQADSLSDDLAVESRSKVASLVVEEPPNLKAQLRILWRERSLIAIATAICTMSAVVASLVLPDKFQATALLYPVTNRAGAQAGGALSAIASQIGGMAGLTGITGEAQTKRAEAIAVLKSRALTERFIASHDMLPILFSNKWDVQNHRWKVTSPRQVPTLWKAYHLFNRSVRKVSLSADTGLVTLKVTWKDPQLAAAWANGLVAMTNDYLRAKAIERADRSIDYLSSEAAKTNVVEEREAIYAVMTMEINKAMLARGSKEYAFRVLDPAQPPELPSSPRPVLWTILGFGGGLFFGVFVAFVRAAWREAE